MEKDEVIMDYDFIKPKGISGVGLDIGWCSNKGGKFCQLCRRRSNFNEWSNSWHFYYLTEWGGDWGWKKYPHLIWNRKHLITHVRPVKYHTRGLNPNEIRSLMRQGCKGNRKCKCISIVQRGHWYCPECWFALNNVAKIHNRPTHDLMVANRKDLKEELLILKLSGAFNGI